MSTIDDVFGPARSATTEAAFAEAMRLAMTDWIIEHGWFATPSRADELRRMPYHEYLRSPEWQQRRRLMLAMARGCCQTCESEGGVDGARLHVHHRHYESRGQEWPEDLVVLCHVCHARVHDRKP